MARRTFIPKRPTVRTRNGYPIAESMSPESRAMLMAFGAFLHAQKENNAAAIRRVFH